MRGFRRHRQRGFVIRAERRPSNFHDPHIKKIIICDRLLIPAASITLIEDQSLSQPPSGSIMKKKLKGSFSGVCGGV